MSDDLEERTYPEDEHLHRLQEDPDRRMTRAEWEREESLARQAAHKKHQQVTHDHEVQQEFDRKKQKNDRNWKKLSLWIGGGVLVLLLIFLLGYLPRHKQAEKAEALAKQREQEEPLVNVIRAERSQTLGALTVPGTTAALTVAFMYARANGYLEKRFVDIGDRVRKGQLLAIIDAPDLDQQVAQAREQLRQAQAMQVQQQAQLRLNRVTWERWRILVAKGVFSRQDGDQQETNYDAQLALVASAQRNVDSYRANLGRLIALQGYERLTAPFDGIVTQRNSDVGALVGPNGAAASAPMQSPQEPNSGSAGAASSNTSGSAGVASQSATPSTGESQGGAIFAVAEFDKLRILVSVPEGYASNVHPSMPAQVFLQERPNQPIAGTVTRIANALDENTRTMLAEVDIPNRSLSLYPGMYAVVRFVQVRGVPPITVPGDAIAIRQDRTVVAIVRDQKIQMTPVQIGRDYGPTVEILNGIQAGDLVVTTVTDSVQPGAKVRIRFDQQAAQTSAGGPQTEETPNSGPSQYGDQSIVNAETESTNLQGKPGQSSGKSNQKSGSEQGQQSQPKKQGKQQ